MKKNKYNIKTKSNDYWNNYYDGFHNMKKTRDPHSIHIQNAKTVIIDHDNNYYCYPVKLEKNDLKEQVYAIADNDYTIFSDLEIISNDEKHYQYEYID